MSEYGKGWEDGRNGAESVWKRRQGVVNTLLGVAQKVMQGDFDQREILILVDGNTGKCSIEVVKPGPRDPRRHP